jgi:hypothetical protein
MKIRAELIPYISNNEQKGIEYYFGRPGPDSKLSIQTSDVLNQLYPDFKTYIFSYPKTK